jgi:hypothetical protein
MGVFVFSYFFLSFLTFDRISSNSNSFLFLIWKQTRGSCVFDCMLNKREGPDAIELVSPNITCIHVTVAIYMLPTLKPGNVCFSL